MNSLTAPKHKLNVEDLLRPLADSSTKGLQSLQNNVKPLVSGSRSGPIPAPLPQRTQDRISRDVAYEQTKKEVEKWQPTMKHIKEVL